MWSRRSFLRTTGTAGAAAIAAFADDGPARVAAAARRIAGLAPGAVAGDETYWREIQQAFTLDRTIINLNNGGVSPSPRVVHERSNGTSTSRTRRRSTTCGRSSSRTSRA
jgi:isopenicillin-N epimerase